MKIDVKVKNFGKIKSANLKIRPFTVIAGKNSSGKSFLTKALYSFFRSINKDFVTLESTALLKGINTDLQFYLDSIRLSIPEVGFADATVRAGLDLEMTALEIYGASTFTSQLDSSSKLLDKLNLLKSCLNQYVSSVQGKKKFEKIKNQVSLVQARIKQLENIINRPGDIYAISIQNEFKNSLKENFQITNLAQLVNFNAEAEEKTEFEFSEIGSIHLDGDSVNFKLWPTGIDILQELSNIVYLESPLYWRLKSALERINDLSSIRYLSRFRKQDALSGVPQYFYDLLELLKVQVKQNFDHCDFANIDDEISNHIGGKVLINQTGDMVYKDKVSGKEINLYATATGIVNLGMVGLLIGRNVISKGSFIIIDEPEVNLHPAWQKVLIDALYKLSRSGINVIIATHSIDMMKCIDCIVSDLPSADAVDHFGINQLTEDGNSLDVNDSPALSVARISEDLGETFYKMQMGI